MSSKSRKGPQATKVLKLSEPIRLGDDTTVETLTFRRPKFRDLKLVPAGNLSDLTMGTLLQLASNLSGTSGEILGELEGEDIGRVIDVVSDFLGESLGTGEEE